MKPKESVVAGRIAVYTPEHPAANNRGYVLRARRVVEVRLGRFLSSTEHVHHINGDPEDDRFENLEVLSRADHARRHAREWTVHPSPRGEEHYNAKLTEAIVRKIRKQYKAGRVSQRKLSEMYKVGRRTIRQVLGGNTWRCVK